MVSRAMSLSIDTWMVNLAPVSLNHSVWYFSFSRSTTAFLTMDWQAILQGWI